MSVLDQAAQLLQTTALCDDCLGRQFAKLSHGLSNAERGKSIRVSMCLSQNIPFIEPSTVCPLCLNHFAKIQSWAERAVKLAEGYEFFTYLMGTRVPAFIREQEDELQQKFQLKAAEKFNQSFNRTVGKLFGELWFQKHGAEVEVNFQHPDVVVNLDLTWDKATLQVNPLYLFGRYRKLIRGIPQTHWPCKQCKGRGCATCSGSGEQYPESVESFIGKPLNEHTQGKSFVLHGAGREDIDALMLGSGRPFVIEIKQPRKRQLDWADMAAHINDCANNKVSVDGLKLVTGQTVGNIKEKKAEKCYQVRVEFQTAIQADDLVQAIKKLIGPIDQQTPQRVAHRRADLVRHRELFGMEGTLLDQQTAQISLHCSGGLYVKELISGDEGRTLPNLSELLDVQAKVVELDVVDILGDFL